MKNKDKNMTTPQTLNFDRIEVIHPPNILKEKVGSGGLDRAVIKAAQEKMYRNERNFLPILEKHMQRIESVLQNRRMSPKDILNEICFAIARMKAQGSMFNYPLVTEVSAMLLLFLPRVEKIDSDILEILSAYQTTVRTIISRDLRGEKTAEGRGLLTELQHACDRYYKYRFNKNR